MEHRHRHRPALWAILPLALVLQLWSLATCCIPGSMNADTPWAPGGTLVICSGAGTKTIDIGDGQEQRQDHGSLCAALCGLAVLGLLVLIGVPGLFGSMPRLKSFGGRPALARAPPLFYRSRAPPIPV